MASPLGFAQALPQLLPALADVAPVAIPLAAIAIPIAALTMGKSEEQLRQEAVAAGQKAFDDASAAAFATAASIAPVGSPLFQKIVEANTVQNLGEAHRTGKYID